MIDWLSAIDWFIITTVWQWISHSEGASEWITLIISRWCVEQSQKWIEQWISYKEVSYVQLGEWNAFLRENWNIPSELKDSKKEILCEICRFESSAGDLYSFRHFSVLLNSEDNLHKGFFSHKKYKEDNCLQKKEKKMHKSTDGRYS